MSLELSASMQIGFRSVDGIAIRYAESAEGDGGTDPTLLLTSPWPESLYAFLPMWQSLAQHGRLVAIDLPGFGHSERRGDLLSPQAMGAFLTRLIDEWRLPSPHIVGPDVGTSAALFAAARRAEAVSSLVVGSGAAAYPLQVGGALKDFIDAPDLETFRSADFQSTLGAVFDTSFERYQLPRQVRQDYLTSYEGDRFVESMRYVRSYPRDLPILGELLERVQTPVQIINNRRDPLVPPVNGEYLHARLPHSKLDVLDGSHFVWEDAADQYAAIIAAWVDGGYQRI